MTAATHPVEQALAEIAAGSFRISARSFGFLDDWDSEAERLCRGFGTPAEQFSVRGAVFAQPFGKMHVAIVQAQGDVRRLQFRLLVVERSVYSRYIADPFLVADRFPADFSNTSHMPALEWAEEAPPPRTIDKLQHVLQTGGSPTLLGAVQALIDGGRLVFERSESADQLVRNLWQLLPYASQAELWPATTAFSADLDFHLLVVPKVARLKAGNYLTEEQALDYPHGRYELALQCAIEHGDQREVDRLFRRRTSRQTLRLAVFILIGAIVLALAMAVLQRI